jgi:uncharacterized protein YcbK (DUF882 family)
VILTSAKPACLYRDIRQNKATEMFCFMFDTLNREPALRSRAPRPSMRSRWAAIMAGFSTKA